MSTEHYDFPNSGMEKDYPLLYISRSQYSGDWRSLPHRHDHAELFFLISGKGQFQVDRQRFPVLSGSLVVVNPHVMHTELSSSEEPLEYIVVGLRSMQFHTRDGQEQRFFHLDNVEDRANYYFYLRMILQERVQMQENYLPICANLLQTFLMQLRRSLTKQSLSIHRARSDTACLLVKQYMDEHYEERISLDFLAELAHMSKYHLVHSFRAEMGCSPMSYLQSQRIAVSRRLLEMGGYSVSQISSMTGFSSASYFSQRFKKVVGTSPQEYARNADNYVLEN